MTTAARRARAREALREAFTRNLPYKAVALLLAVLTWGMVQGQQEVEATAAVAVQVLWPEGLAVTQGPPSKVHITVVGPRTAVRRLARAHLLLRLDLREAGPGVQTIDFIGREVEGLPQGLRVRGLTPSSVQVQLEPLEQVDVPVQAATRGKVADGYRLLAIDLQPEVVRVEGPASVVGRLDHVETEPIPLADVTGNAELEVGVVLPDRSLRRVDAGPIRVRLQVAALFRERTFGGVPVVPRRPGWRVVPDVAQVTLLGPVAELERIAPDEVTAMVQIPEDLPPERREVGVGGRPPRVEILHPGGREVRVGSVEPSRFILEPLR